MRRLVLVALAAAAIGTLLVVFYRGFGSDPHAVPFMMTGQKAPPFKLRRLDTGETVELAQFAGKPVVLNFWATWCGPCKAEHPWLQAAAEKYKDRVVFLGVVVEDTEVSTRKFLAENGMTYPQLYDAKSTIAIDYGISGVPETYFIDTADTIRGKYIEPVNGRSLEAGIQQLLQ